MFQDAVIDEDPLSKTAMGIIHPTPMDKWWYKTHCLMAINRLELLQKIVDNTDNPEVDRVLIEAYDLPEQLEEEG